VRWKVGTKDRGHLARIDWERGHLARIVLPTRRSRLTHYPLSIAPKPRPATTTPSSSSSNTWGNKGASKPHAQSGRPGRSSLPRSAHSSPSVLRWNATSRRVDAAPRHHTALPQFGVRGHVAAFLQATCRRPTPNPDDRAGHPYPPPEGTATSPFRASRAP